MGFTSGGGEDVFSTLVKNKICENVWAICINEAGTKSNGTLTIGGKIFFKMIMIYYKSTQPGVKFSP